MTQRRIVPDITKESWIAFGLGQQSTPYVDVEKEAQKLYERSLDAIFDPANDAKTVRELREELLIGVTPEVISEFHKILMQQSL